MTVPSHFHMPGGFHAEGVHPGLFRPPMSPSSSTSYGYAAPRATPSFDAHPRRKRQRDEISRSREMPAAAVTAAPATDDGFPSTSLFGTGTPAARAMPRHYQLAGQLDTPNSGPGENNLMDESMYSDSDYRRALGSKRSCDEDLDTDMTGPTPLFHLPPQPTQYQGWGSFAFTTIGGVVGKVWEFCKAGAFRGFQAGGGQAFRVTPGGVQEIHTFSEKMNGDGSVLDHFLQHDQQADQYPLGPADEQVSSGASTPTGPATKRRHTDHRDDLGRNWVMVDDSQPASEAQMSHHRSSQRQPPRSRNAGPSMATGRRISTPASRVSSTPTPTPSMRRQSSRQSVRPASRQSVRPASRQSIRPASRQSIHSVSRPPSRFSRAASPPTPAVRPSTASTASVASFPSYATAMPRSPSPTKIPQPRSNSRRRHTLAPSPSPGMQAHRRSQSNASTASGRGSVDESPRLDAEAKHLAARRKMEERDADVRIATFNKQLQDMIRQGKEALGTTIEVEGNWEDDY